ncbi:hypothetical protein D7V92_05245 [Parabacteroides sp. CH2-D42-20]|nr:hypothetical protein D7V92_05245 [Parabacteroides sp. CH2-D42-20]
MCPVQCKSFSLVSFLMAFTVCMQNPIWPLWGIWGTWLGYSSVFLLYIIMQKNKQLSIRVSDLMILILMFFVFLIIPCFYAFRTSSLFIVLSYFLALNIDRINGKKTLDYISSFLYWVILVSLPAWLIHLNLFEFQNFGQLDLSEMKGAPYIYNNYILFVMDATRDYYRFYSVFDEPGVLGTLSAFVLYGNKYNFKRKENIVILIGCLFTYSMAFYMITLLGWLYQSAISFKRLIMSIVAIILVVGILVYFMADDQAFQQSVIERFTDVGLDRVEGRTGSNVNVFWDKYIASSDVFLGMGTSFINDNLSGFGNSYKRFVIEYGLIGTILLIVMYFHLVKRWNRLTLGFFVLFFLSFLQRPLAFSSWQIFVFIAVISNLYIRLSSKNNVN